MTDYRRKTKFETQYDPEPYIQAMSVNAAQEGISELSAVGTAMDMLSPDHKEILTLVCVQDKSYQEVSEILNIPVGTVRSRLSRAREHLQVLLDNPHKRDSVIKSYMPPAYIAAHTLQQTRAA